MLVIVSLNWIELDGRFSPVQLAALRIRAGRTWSVADEYYTLFRPRYNNSIQWGKAHKGIDQRAFFSAPKARDALKAFLKWLRPNDVLCWWDERSATAFKSIVLHILGSVIDRDMCLIAPALAAGGMKAALSGGSAHSICRSFGIKVASPEQYAKNSVEAMRLLLAKAYLATDAVLKYKLDKNHVLFIGDESQGKSSAPSVQSTDSNAANQQEPTLDPTRKLHAYERNAIERQSRAARDRAAGSRKDLPENTNDFRILTNPGYAFWAARGYKTFHLRDCRKLEGLSDLRGFSKFGDAICSGLKPCKYCRPSQSDNIYESVPIDQRVRKDEDPAELDPLCDAAGFLHEYDAPYYSIQTPVGIWKLKVGTRPLEVLHSHAAHNDRPPAFHKQHRIFLSLKDTFRYIKKHDASVIAGCPGAKFRRLGASAIRNAVKNHDK